MGASFVDKQSLPTKDLKTFQTTVSTSSVAVNAKIKGLRLGVWVMADESNTAPIWIGDENVDANVGFPITSNTDTQFIPVEDLDTLKIISNTANQVLVGFAL
jgi:hypothetical protein